jgi:hypothetical protein
MARTKVDFQVVDHGTIFLLYPRTRRAKRWVAEKLPRDHIKYADASLVEHRCIGDIVDGIRADDLEIAFSRVPLPS